MSEAPTPAPVRPAPRSRLRWLLPALFLVALLASLLVYYAVGRTAVPQAAAAPPAAAPDAPRPPTTRRRRNRDVGSRRPNWTAASAGSTRPAPSSSRTSAARSSSSTSGRYCCINCMHMLPDLARLEKKYANELVVIGVHSAKFDNEKDSDSIRKAILRYEISHPVVNDAHMTIWNAYEISSWPTLVLIDPEGNLVARGSGEGLYDALDLNIQRLIKEFREKKTLNEKPMHFELARFSETADSPLFFPGKVLADAAGKRLFIADSTHHRIVITDLDGKKIAVAGIGRAGADDGGFDKATFNDPQGMALDGDTLYVADRKNNLIRALDLKAKTVKTVAGTGEQGDDRAYDGPALKAALNSPWDLLLHDGQLYIAMAGLHQIWKMDLAKGTIALYAGTGIENIRDGSLASACFAQPSGLATDGKTLFVADSEVERHPGRAAGRLGQGEDDRRPGIVRFRRRGRRGRRGALAARPRRGLPRRQTLRGRHL